MNVLPLSNDDAGLRVRDERIKMVSFTGSAKVGWLAPFNRLTFDVDVTHLHTRDRPGFDTPPAARLIHSRLPQAAEHRSVVHRQTFEILDLEPRARVRFAGQGQLDCGTLVG